MPQSSFDELEQKIDALIALCSDLVRENTALRSVAARLRKERQHLEQRNTEASSRVEAIIGHLKAAEPDS